MTTVTVNGTSSADTISVVYESQPPLGGYVYAGWYVFVNNQVTNFLGRPGTDPLPNVVVDAGDGNDFVALTTYNPQDPFGGSDSYSGYPVASTVLGGNGNDSIQGGSSNDSLSGGGGNDKLRASKGSDVLSGGSGTDNGDYTNKDSNSQFSDTVYRFNITINASASSYKYAGGSSSTSEIDTVSTTVENIDTGDGNDTVMGSDQANYITGGNGVDTIDAYIGTDTINGGAGNDSLTGGDGDDLLIGGTGTDRMFGNAGIDSFRAADSGTVDYCFGGADNDVFLDADQVDRDNAVSV